MPALQSVSARLAEWRRRTDESTQTSRELAVVVEGVERARAMLVDEERA